MPGSCGSCSAVAAVAAAKQDHWQLWQPPSRNTGSCSSRLACAKLPACARGRTLLRGFCMCQAACETARSERSIAELIFSRGSWHPEDTRYIRKVNRTAHTITYFP